MDGLAATLAGIAAIFFAIDALTVHENEAVLALSLALRSAVRRLPAVQPPRGEAGGRCSWATPAARCSGFSLAALGLTASWKVAGTTVATLLLPVLVLAVPILDTTLVTVVRLLDGRPVYQGGRDHTSHRLVYHGLSEKRAVVLLAVISAALGATSLFYAVLDNAWVTLIGVLLTFALLVQFASVLSDVERSPGLVERPRLATDVHCESSPPRRIAGRLRAHHRLVRSRLLPQTAGKRHRVRTAHLPRLARRAARRALCRVHPVRPVSRSVALRRRARCGCDRRRSPRLRGRRVSDPRCDAGVGRFSAQHLHHRRARLHHPRRRVTVLGARVRTRSLGADRTRRPEADGDRRCRARGPQPAPRTA